MKADSALYLLGAIASSVGVAAAPAHLSGLASSSAAGPTVVTNTHWSGAVYNGQGVTNIEASFVIPSISGQSSDDSVAVWVGIDGATSGRCGNTLMQAGLLLYGDGSIRPWYEWWPGEAIQFFDESWDVQAGDNIFMQVQANTTTSGVTYITNQRTGNTLTHQFYSNESPSPLCEVSADWVIETISFGNGNFATLPDFGTITLTGTSATTSRGTVTADDAAIWDMAGYQNNRVNCKHAGSGSVSCTRV
ncbi:hypothetical protein NLG97_g5429 [Lecanicillium saksenae]|uniref:Uncharacterized protein n=1 Tax=Lecanicillium saksenae TaxID=468837 RepID=A0ACC1QU79_9HYPO|nr:hypothetical protein NLG97_g5429 [Lecanicillium saksenae]